MKKLVRFATIAVGLVLIGGFFAFQTMNSSAELDLKLQNKMPDFKVVPLEDYTGSMKDLPAGTKKFTKVRVDAKTKISSERTFLQIPN